MQTLFNRIAWNRMQRYILRHTSNRIVVTGTYGRTLVATMAYHAMRQHHHMRLGYPVQDTSDIPLGILGRDHETDHQNIISFLTGAWQNELHEIEPDTIITEVPLLYPGFIPYATSRILPALVVLHHVAEAEEEYKEAVHYLAKDVLLIVNADDEAPMRISHESGLQSITYGRHPNADIRITRTVRGDAQEGIFITINAGHAHQDLFLPHLFAKEHVSAFACAVACAYARKVPVVEAMRSIQHMPIPYGALRKEKGSLGEVVITEHMECMAQLIESLKSFASLPHAGRKIVIVGDAGESLSGTSAEYGQLAQHAVQASSLLVFVGNAMRPVQSIVDTLGKKVDTHHFATQQEALIWLRGHMKSTDMVYIPDVTLDI